MAKFMSLILLLVVAISWSQTNASPLKRSIAKRSTEEVVNEDLFGEEFVKEMFAEVLLLGAKPEEEPTLEKRFREAMELKFDSTEEYAKKLLEIFEEVTGREFTLNDSTFDESDATLESADKSNAESLLAGPRAVQV